MVDVGDKAVTHRVAVATGRICMQAATLDLIRSERPGVTLHVSPQASATKREAVGLYAEEFGVARVAIPASLPGARLRHLLEDAPVELELFGHGSYGVMLEGQCALSSWITGASVGRDGACSPARVIRVHRSGGTVFSRLNGVLIDARPARALAHLPAACRGTSSTCTTWRSRTRSRSRARSTRSPAWSPSACSPAVRRTYYWSGRPPAS